MNDNKYQDFLEKLQNADESERDWLVMEFSLQNLSETLRQAVVAAAIPHWFDHDFLNAILKFPLKDSDFETLINLSFVEIFPERGFNIHERSRNLLLEYLWKHNKARYQKLSKHASAYCKKQDQTITHWRVETIYHDLLADNMKADDNLIKQAGNWHNSFQYDKLENLTQVIIFEALDNKRLTGKVGAWVTYWQAKIDIIYSRYLSAQNLLKQAIKQNSNNHFLADCIRASGEVYLYLNDYEQAQNCFQRALVLYRHIKDPLGEANCLLMQGDTHYCLAEYDQVRNCYQQALVIYRQIKNPIGEANCLLTQGGIYYRFAEYDQAWDSYKQALVIYQQIQAPLSEANCLRSLGRLLAVGQQVELAVVKLKQAAQLYEKCGNKHGHANCFNDLMVIYREQKHFEQALTMLNQAIEIFPEVGFYQNRSALYMQIDDYEKADEDIKQAEKIGQDPAYTLLRKAELSLWQQQTLQAIELSQQALDKRPEDGGFRAMFALTLLVDRQTEKANAEMQQALTAIYQPHDFDELFENLDKLIRIYGERPEFETMRELITCSPRYKASREIKLANMIWPNPD